MCCHVTRQYSMGGAFGIGVCSAFETTALNETALITS